MPDWLTPGLVEQAAQALLEGPFEHDDAGRALARAVLEAVGPAIHAAGWAERGKHDKASIEALGCAQYGNPCAYEADALAAVGAHDKAAP